LLIGPKIEDGGPDFGDRGLVTEDRFVCILRASNGGNRMVEKYKFQRLTVYQLALDYVDEIYSAIVNLPENERYNLSSQFRRAATSIPLNIAEGSTGQSDLEQHRFLGIALRSYLETIACMDIIERRSYMDSDQLNQTRQNGHRLFIKSVSFRKKLINNHSQ
jgi:four helix bundle protein